MNRTGEDSGSQAPTSTRGRRRFRQVAGTALIVAVVVFAGIALKRNWDAVRDDLGLLEPADYLASIAAATAGLFALWASWSTVLRGLGGRLPASDSRTIYFAGQLGKYVPGSVWPAVIQARLGRRNGLAGTTMVVSYALWLGVLCAVGAITGALVLTSADIEISTWTIVAAVVVAIGALPVLLHDSGLPRLITWAVRRTGRDVASVRIDSAPARDAVILSALTWLVLGLHAWFLARPLGADLDDLPLVIGAFSLAFVAGIVAVPLPAGAGLREAILVLTLGATIGRPAAITVALLSRLIMIVVELLLASFTGVPSAIRWVRSTSDLPER